MVKKLLSSGVFCEKCMQIEELLKKRGYIDRIDTTVIAEEGDPESPGMKLAARYEIEVAPFFIVRDDTGEERIYTRALEMINREFKMKDKKKIPPPEGGINTAVPEITEMTDQLAGLGPEAIIEFALSLYGADCALAFSGAEDVVLIDMAVKSGLPFSVFCLDTGRLHSQTYRFIEKVRTRYGIQISLVAPDYSHLEPFVQKKGLFSFYQEGHKECCGIRKVEPLKRTLGKYKAWAAGQRKDQNPSTRGDVPVVQEDPAFSGIGNGRDADAKLIKFNPLADFSLQDVWSYIRTNDVPHNELHDRGFVSIGCEPCTRATRPGEHERAGRWWWEEETQRECGLHVKTDK